MGQCYYFASKACEGWSTPCTEPAGAYSNAKHHQRIPGRHTALAALNLRGGGPSQGESGPRCRGRTRKHGGQLTVATCNVTSLGPHLPALLSLPPDVWALQEVQVIEPKQRIWAADAAMRGYQAIWGLPVSVKERATQQRPDAGGVAVLARNTVRTARPPSPICDAERALLRSTR